MKTHVINLLPFNIDYSTSIVYHYKLKDFLMMEEL